MIDKSDYKISNNHKLFDSFFWNIPQIYKDDLIAYFTHKIALKDSFNKKAIADQFKYNTNCIFEVNSLSEIFDQLKKELSEDDLAGFIYRFAQLRSHEKAMELVSLSRNDQKRDY
ncbi:hypothetical protein BOVMAS02_09090 [Streptococcus uberis]|uniref:hypothetical protein n=1 Tax=Streptococcus uberis TaxID=1349 RepID=UPI00062025E0|nr:hypothetical protein [Streptococcus uberis]KKF43412.1 hypothetical protein AF64_02230 [Streptococcus uberis C9359]KKF44716.1 hypothetical protein AF63_02225 [Streptococcus uberis Ab71]KKF46612.1 hypothetical protein AF62_01665 [Streptococcus uberis C8329]KKF48498.1 hypothetical protein AF59_05140 [Streptococcus uberis C5072]KKF51089.1 hypothetical protein AF60_05210 [Streptococcus uberis S6261]